MILDYLLKTGIILLNFLVAKPRFATMFLKPKNIMKKLFISVSFVFICFGLNLVYAESEHPNIKIEFASSPNPVGSGARAMGMGGAFISVADDATAASWNPAGLLQINWSEVSVVGNWFHRTEDNSFGINPEADGTQSVSSKDINYFSLTYPFVAFEQCMPMVISLNYQQLYEFNREWNVHFIHRSISEFVSLTEYTDVDYDQTGTLSALGIAYAFKLPVKEHVYFGSTLNLWDDDLFNNEWDEKYYQTGKTTLIHSFPGVPSSIETVSEYIRTDHYSFSGFNANLGLLWKKVGIFKDKDYLKVGMVVKLPFTADLTHKRTQDQMLNGDSLAGIPVESGEELDMPLSYGIGISYRPSNTFTISADIYRTEWDDFILTDSNGHETSPITNESPEASDIDATHQIRLGTEYLYHVKGRKYQIPFRAGLFYDPAPAKGGHDDYYGFSLGSGFESYYVVFDVAYQCRLGKDVASSLLPSEADFSQDVEEHIIYASVIFRFKEKKK